MPVGFWIGYAERLALVALLLIVLYAALRAMRRTRFWGRERGTLAVLETVALSPHAWLHLVRGESRSFIVGSGAVTLIAEVEAGPENDSRRNSNV